MEGDVTTSSFGILAHKITQASRGSKHDKTEANSMLVKVSVLRIDDKNWEQNFFFQFEIAGMFFSVELPYAAFPVPG